MALDKQVEAMIERAKDTICLARKQEPGLYLGKSHELVPGEIHSTPVGMWGEGMNRDSQEWKYVKSEVHNYLVTFRGINPSTISGLREHCSEMREKMAYSLIGRMNPQPLNIEELKVVTWGGRTDFALYCGRAIFMEEIGMEETTIRNTLKVGEESTIFSTEPISGTKGLSRVVKVTFCPTWEILEYVAEKYPVQSTEPIFIDLQVLKTLGFYRERDRSVIDKLFGR